MKRATSETEPIRIHRELVCDAIPATALKPLADQLKAESRNGESKGKAGRAPKGAKKKGGTQHDGQ